MAQIRKAEGQVEIKSDADKFFKLWAYNPQEISKMCPDKIAQIELNEGEWGKAGCITTSHYAVHGQHQFIKSKVEEINENTKSVTYNYLEGPALTNHYKSFKSKIQIIPKGDNCVVKWTYDYEKANEDAPDAEIYMYFALNCVKDIDAHLSNA